MNLWECSSRQQAFAFDERICHEIENALRIVGIKLEKFLNALDFAVCCFPSIAK